MWRAGWQLCGGLVIRLGRVLNRPQWPIDNRPQLTKLPHKGVAHAYRLPLPFHSISMSSKLRPLVSGVTRQTKTTVNTQIAA